MIKDKAHYLKEMFTGLSTAHESIIDKRNISEWGRKTGKKC